MVENIPKWQNDFISSHFAFRECVRRVPTSTHMTRRKTDDHCAGPAWFVQLDSRRTVRNDPFSRRDYCD